MSRPRTKGDPIQFRLPIQLHTYIATRAASRGESPSQWVERNITRLLEAEMVRTAPIQPTEPKLTPSIDGSRAEAFRARRQVRHVGGAR